MRVASIQMEIAFGEVERNYDKARRLIAQAAEEGADIVALPELWNTSFYPDNVFELADEDGRRTKEFLSALAKEYGINIFGGSVANRRGQVLYNTTYVVSRQGDIVATYDKVHLFSPGHEDQIFQPGNKPNVFELDGVRMASIICYDLRFCEWVRMAALAGAQMLFVPASWPYPRLTHWQVLNQARAIENQFFVVSINGAGMAGKLQLCGGSRIINPWGEILDEAGDTEKILAAEVDFSMVQDIRSHINVFRDRRPELYHLP